MNGLPDVLTALELHEQQLRVLALSLRPYVPQNPQRDDLMLEAQNRVYAAMAECARAARAIRWAIKQVEGER